MPTFRITSAATGTVLGHFEADTPQGALDALFNGSGWEALDDYRSRLGDDPNDLVVSQVIGRDELDRLRPLMDEGLSEQVGRELPEHEPHAFLARYCELHRAKHGRDFSWERQEGPAPAGDEAQRNQGEARNMRASVS